MEMSTAVGAMDVLVTSDPPLSPDLCLDTMNTSDMFDVGWDTSSGVESGDLGSSSSSSLSPHANHMDDDFVPWDTDELLQANLLHANLNQLIADDGDLLSFADFPPVVDEEDFTFLEDTSSNLSFASDISTSSSTITSYSIPCSPDLSLFMADDEAQESIAISSASQSDISSTSTVTSSAIPCSSDQSLFLTDGPLESLPESKVASDLRSELRLVSPNAVSSEKCQNGRKESSKVRRSKKKSKKERKLVSIKNKTDKKRKDQEQERLSGSSAVPSPSNTTTKSQQPKMHTKENQLSPSKKKIFNILDSNIRWSELSDAEQTAVGEGLEMVLTRCLGLRERLDLMVMLDPDTAMSSLMPPFGDVEWVIKLDDEKLKILRQFLRSLDTRAAKAERGKPQERQSKKILKDNSWQNVKYERTAQNRKQLLMEPGKQSHIAKQRQTPKQCTSEGKGSKVKQPTSLIHQNKTPERKGRGYETLRLRTRSRKEYRQLMKERKSGLFEKEEVVSVSSSTQPYTQPTPKEEQEDEDLDIDILG